MNKYIERYHIYAYILSAKAKNLIEFFYKKNLSCTLYFLLKKNPILLLLKDLFFFFVGKCKVIIVLIKKNFIH